MPIRYFLVPEKSSCSFHLLEERQTRRLWQAHCQPIASRVHDVPSAPPSGGISKRIPREKVDMAVELSCARAITASSNRFYQHVPLPESDVPLLHKVVGNHETALDLKL